MKNEYLLAGSYAYDTIMLHEGQFHTKILPESLSRLNVSFAIDSVKEEFGGTAGNIAYNASLLQSKPLLIGCVGHDGEPYLNKLRALNLDVAITTYSEDKTAHCWLMTDQTSNQIIGFNAGAMKRRPNLPTDTPDLWHLAADNPFTTAWLAKTAVEQGKKYFFDPGQPLPYFLNGETNSIYSLEDILKNASGIFVNDYESELLEKYLGMKLSDFVKNHEGFVIKTLGSKGVEVLSKDSVITLPVAHTNKIVDPTGCGDAFRAGFLYYYTKGESLEKCAQLGATMGALAIEEHGGQNHTPSAEDIFNRLNQSYANTKKLKL